MNKLSSKELQNIEGGVLRLTAGKFIGFGAAGAFLIGIISGYLRPLTCNSDK